MKIKRPEKEGYGLLIHSIGSILEKGRRQAYYAVNSILVKTYWEIGKQIIRYEQRGNEKAEYGTLLLDKLSKDLKLRFGSGFSKSNVYLMRQFYLKYRKFQTLSGKLSWSHYSELLSIDDDLSRQFYENQCLRENWSVRELRRQIGSALFYRIALSKDKASIQNLSKSNSIK